MHEHLLKAVLSGGTSAVGQFVRWWLLSTGTLAMAGGAFILAVDTHGHGVSMSGALFGAMLGLLVFSVPLALPVAVVVALAIIALKW